MGSTRGAGLDAQEGGKKQGLHTVTHGAVLVREQGTVITRVRVLMSLDGLRALGHNRGKGPLVIEPMGQEVDAHRGQTGPHLDDRCAGGRRPQAWGVSRAALRPIALPPVPQAIEIAHTEVKGGMRLGDLVEQEPTGALGVVMQHGPHPGLLDVTTLSTGTKGWT
jgi:hypothetical protein